MNVWKYVIICQRAIMKLGKTMTFFEGKLNDWKARKKDDPKIQMDLGAIMFNILEELLKLGYL